MTTPIASSARLAHLPAAFFATVMGLAGLTIAWEKGQQVLDLDLGLSPWLIGASTALFTLLLVLYIAKLILYRPAVLAELRHPVRLSFMPTISISLLLLAVAFQPLAPTVSLVLWLVGTPMQLAFTLYIVGVWIQHEHFQVQHLNPAWFIPAVGNALVPIAGVPLGQVEVSWFFFSVGMMLWSVLVTIVFYRVLFHDPLEERLLPTLFILIAPPAVGFIAYLRLTDTLDVFAQALYFAGLFLTLLLFSQGGRFLRLGFFLTWWAYSFPLAAVSIASMVMYEQTGTGVYRYIGVGLLTMLTGIITLLVAATLVAVWERRICIEEPAPRMAPAGGEQ